jgi:ribosomal protein L22
MTEEPNNTEADVEETPVAETPAAESPTETEAPAEEPAVVEEPVADAPQPEPVAEKPAKEPKAKKAKDDTPAPAAKPAPARKRDADENERPVVRAQAKYVRTSARKARMVCDQIRGKGVEEAYAILAHTPRAVAEDWEKLLKSAVANAENNHELLGDDLKIVAVFADEGPTLKRFRPRAMGRATPIRKRTSHLTIQLTPKD